MFGLVSACGSSHESVFSHDGGGDTGGTVRIDGGGSSDGTMLRLGHSEGGSLGSSDVAAPSSLYFTPASASVVVTSTAPVKTRFTLEAKDENGTTETVTPDSVQFDRPDLATVVPGNPVVLTAPSSSTLYGGTGTLQAIYHGKAATATLTVQVKVTTYSSGLSATSPAVVALNGASLATDPAAKISPLLYPYDKTVWPLGLTSPLTMWNAPQANDVYHLHYEEKNYVVDGYYALASLPAQLRLDQSTWDRLTASNDAANGADPLSFTLSRWDHVANAAYATSSQTWTVAPESLRGAIYYWTASQDASGVRRGHISRFQPGTGAQPTPLNNGKCMGCHAVNAQGTVLVADIDDLNASEYPDGGPNTDPSVGPYGNWSKTRAWASFDVANVQGDAGIVPKLETNKFGADVALTPDGEYVVFGGPTNVATGGSSIGTPAIAGSKLISLAKTSTGVVVSNSGLDDVDVDVGLGLMMPAFSPDGTKLAVIESPLSADNVIPSGASPDAGVNECIATIDFNESGPTFSSTLTKIVDGNSATFATTGRGLAYPSFSPDSTALAFHAGRYTTGCNANGCDDNAIDDGNLFIVSLASGSPIRLAAADDPPAASDLNSSVEPTFNPIQRGGYSWVVFTSMRAWGNQPWPGDVTSTALVNGKRRLWVAAVDPTLGTVDPSHPAIYLEGQEDSPNMRGFWTLASCLGSAGASGSSDASSPVDGGTACSSGFQCCSGFCVGGQCATVAQVACSGVGGSCKTSTDCCNAGDVTCSDGMCEPVSK